MKIFILSLISALTLTGCNSPQPSPKTREEVYPKDQIPFEQAKSVAQEWIRRDFSETYDVNSAQLLFYDPDQWIIEFRDPSTDILPNTIHVLVDKQTGKAQVRHVTE